MPLLRRERAARGLMIGALALVTTGCAGTRQAAVDPAVPAIEPAPALAPLTTAPAGTMVVAVNVPVALARSRAERLAAGCWLDGLLQGNAVMLVNRRSGEILMEDGDTTLVEVAFRETGPASTVVLLSGTRPADPGTAGIMREDVARGVGEGIDRC